MRWKHHDRRGFSIGYCEEPDGRWYWHVYHPKYGERHGFELGQNGAYRATRYAVGDMRQGL